VNAPPPVNAPPSPTVTNPAQSSSGLFGTTAIDLARLRLVESLGTMNGYDVEIHKKFALAVACVVFVLLGAPIALRFPRGGVGLVIGVSLFVFAAYYSFLIAGEELSNRGMLPPWIAMWAANVLFTAVGLPLALRMGSESGTARGGGFAEVLERIRFWRQRRSAVVAQQA
jgi:lipopolysaccharide export system permease protein